MTGGVVTAPLVYRTPDALISEYPVACGQIVPRSNMCSWVNGLNILARKTSPCLENTIPPLTSSRDLRERHGEAVKRWNMLFQQWDVFHARAVDLLTCTCSTVVVRLGGAHYLSLPPTMYLVPGIRVSSRTAVGVARCGAQPLHFSQMELLG